MSGSGLVCFRKALGSYTKAATVGKLHELSNQHLLPDDANSLFKNRKLKFGHIGTLDPSATGLLMCAFGEATKVIPYIEVDPKRYIGVVKLGYETDTADFLGKTLSEGPKEWKRPDEDRMNEICSKFVGSVEMKPPIFSAVNINGKRAYDLARAGEITLDDMPAKTVNVYKLKYRFLTDDEFEIDVTCGSGTYIRSIARDMALAMGTKGFMKSLDRVQMGRFHLNHDEDHKIYSFKDILDMCSLPFYIPKGYDFGRSMLKDINGGNLSKAMRNFNQVKDGRYSIYYQHSDLPHDVGNNEYTRPVSLVEKRGQEWKYIKNFNYKEHW